MKVIKLAVIFLSWCWSDIIENYQDIKFRYLSETNEEIQQLYKDLEK